MLASTRRRRRSGGSALVSYTPSGPVPAGLNFSRSSSARYFDQNGIEQFLPTANSLRNGHYVGPYRMLYLADGNTIGGAGWTTNGVGEVTPGQPDSQGGTAACLVQATGGQTTGCILHTVPAAVGWDGAPRTMSIDVKQGTSTAARLSLYDSVAPAHRAYISVTFNGSAPPTLAVITGTVTLGNPIDMGGGWWRIPWTVTAGLVANITAFICYPDPTLGTRNCYFGRPQVESGSAATVYTPIATAPQLRYLDSGISTLVEGARTNSLLWSRDLTNAAWTKVGTGTVLLNAVGLDGNANTACTLTDNDAAAHYQASQNVVVPVDSNTHVAYFVIGKDSTQSRFVFCYAIIQGGTAVQRGVHLNTATGASVATNITGTTTSRVVDWGWAWVVEITLTNNSTAGNTTLQSLVCPARSTTIGVDNVAATGSCVVMHMQVELNANFLSSPITTASGIASRSADVPLIPFGSAIAALTGYIKGVNLGTAQDPAAPRLITLGGGGNPRFIMQGNSSGNTLRGIILNSAAVSSGPIPAQAVNQGDSVEMRLAYAADGSNVAGVSVAGAAEVTAVGTTVPIIDQNYSAPSNLYIGTAPAGANTGFFAFQAVKLLAGVHSLDEMRAA